MALELWVLGGCWCYSPRQCRVISQWLKGEHVTGQVFGLLEVFVLQIKWHLLKAQVDTYI